tara:strand:+ start:264 stop:389 length:126 start_codon:yes stop_codon:yes gene_type:complete
MSKDIGLISYKYTLLKEIVEGDITLYRMISIKWGAFGKNDT